ncbi:3'-5' RNA helicase YTHDC2 [Holothuria leucospilota]|uniref:3'-5' RNA helicase YTHDC2 n=1 Tax=Holothuria leucospilota TaxID=206669 RepID=A0A9Q1GZ43_HOLLE|nr:3'-5' RNA helicase YTHDC2 [Holothuria leucospilota]
MGKNTDRAVVSEDFKIGVDALVRDFRYDETKRELVFPSSLDNIQRKYIHQLVAQLGLKSKSKGSGLNRYLTLYKKDATSLAEKIPVCQFTQTSRSETQALSQQSPVTVRERQELLPRMERRRPGPNDGKKAQAQKTHARANPAREMAKTTGKLNNGLPQHPPKRCKSELDSFRRSLPIFSMQDDIIRMITNNRVSIIAGETGSGKTTQVPQFILDACCDRREPCRIICTQPRRLSALSISQRVAAERGENVGQTVGYQIRLESRVSPKTLLTFCTNGVLLRTLMTGDSCLSSISHVIIDEIHERDQYSDFLLTQLRELLSKHPHLRLVLMSAALDTELFIRYFNNAPLLTVPGKLFDVEELFLEDALKCTGYTTKLMDQYKKDKAKKITQKAELEKWNKSKGKMNPQGASSAGHGSFNMEALHRAINSPEVIGGAHSKLDTSIEVNDLPGWLIEEMDMALSDAWKQGSEEAFLQVLILIMNESVSVNFQHTQTSVTPLMAAAAQGNMDIVERLLHLGANVHLRAANNQSALDLAKHFGHEDIEAYLRAYIASVEEQHEPDAALVDNSTLISVEDKELLEAYQNTFDDDRVDINLILTLIGYICQNSSEGAILVFLPGYDEIVTLRDTLMNNDHFGNTALFRIYTLHSSMQSSDQVRVFKTIQGVRKIVLSTNIAESSITINDVVFVIDSGKVKEKMYDALTSVSQLKSVWISKANSKQRRGRAGRCRPGMCFHMFSRARYQSLPDFQTPEILRMPLHELCLHTKLLAPVTSSVADFLAKAPQPPAHLAIRNALQLLQSIDAMDQWEDLTELGCHLADLPIEPHLGKMVLYSIVLKCLDPILTIACALAYKDPFILPKHASQRRASHQVRKKYAANTFSDHMALLRAFQSWQRAKADGWEKSFCERNYLSPASLEMIVGMRTQLLGQLRASGFVRARGPGDIKDLNTNSENWAVVKCALCAGMYPNIIRADKQEGTLLTKQEKNLRFHPTSVLNDEPNENCSVKKLQKMGVCKLPSEWFIYEEQTRVFRTLYVRCVTLVSPITIVLFCGPSCLPEDALTVPNSALRGQSRMGPSGDGESSCDDEDVEGNNMAVFKMDSWLQMKMDIQAANLAVTLRQKCHTLFLRRMRTPAKPWSQADEAILRTLITVLSSEEQALGLQQPVGVGQRPKPMAMDNFNSPPQKSVGNRLHQSGVMRGPSSFHQGAGSSQDRRGAHRFGPSQGSRGPGHRAPYQSYVPPRWASYGGFNSNSNNSNQDLGLYQQTEGFHSGIGASDVAPPPGFQPLTTQWSTAGHSSARDDHKRTPSPPGYKNLPNPKARPFDPSTLWYPPLNQNNPQPLAHSTPLFHQGPSSQLNLRSESHFQEPSSGGDTSWTHLQQDSLKVHPRYNETAYEDFGGSKMSAWTNTFGDLNILGDRETQESIPWSTGTYSEFGGGY